MAGYMIDNIRSGVLRQWYLEDVAALPRDGSVTLLDTRTVGEYSRGHVDGFRNIPVDELRERIGELEGLTAAERLSNAEFDALQRRLASLSACVDAMTVEEKRAAIRAVVRKVIWDGVNAHVVLFGAQDGEPELPELTDRLAPPEASAAQAEEFLDETGETESPTAPMWPWCEDSK
jgi:hypothetical protein